jgi:hypothetical protein
LGGITEDTYVTLTYTNPDGTTGGLSDYYGALGSQYIFCARQNTATASHGIIMENAQEHQPHLHQHQHQHLSLSLSLHQLLRSTDIATSAPTQAGGTINITGGEPNESLNLAITMTYFDSVYFGSLDFAPPSAPTVFATNIVAGSVQLDLNGNASASYYGSSGDAAYNISKNNWKKLWRSITSR